MKVIKLDDFRKEATERFGPDAKKWKYKCPRCGTEQSLEDLINTGMSEDTAYGYIGFSCIGRFCEDKGCDWTLGGLLCIHKLEIETDDGEKHKHFELADIAEIAIAKEN